MAKENFEDALRRLKGESEEETGLGKKLRNAVQKAKETLEKKEMDHHTFDNYIINLMRDEGIIPEEIVRPYSLTHDFIMHLIKKLGLKQSYGMETYYSYFKNTPISEKAKKNIAMYNELESKVKEYVNSCTGKPTPKEFRDFIYSVVPEEAKELGNIGKMKSHFYVRMRSKFRIQYYNDIPSINKDIKSELENLDLSDLE